MSVTLIVVKLKLNEVCASPEGSSLNNKKWTYIEMILTTTRHDPAVIGAT